MIIQLENCFDFEKWGKFSGGEINKSKTKILNINGVIDKEFEHLCVDEMRILGVKFDRNGISSSNIKEVFNKIDSSLYLWNFKQFDMMQRITALKTFILSKLWFILNFITLQRNEIIILERKIFQFLWSDQQELIKRATLIKAKEENGLDMIDINSKIVAIKIKQYLYLLKNYNRIEYQYCLKWLKFKMRDFINNINIIPYETGQNEFYENIIIIINQNRATIDELINKNMQMNLKFIYKMIKAKREINPKIEIINNHREIDWKTVYNKNLFKKLPSRFKIFNYKLLFGVISTRQKIFKMKRCNFCYKQLKEDIIDHLYFKCIKLYSYGELNLCEENFKKLNKNNLIYLNFVKLRFSILRITSSCIFLNCLNGHILIHMRLSSILVNDNVLSANCETTKKQYDFIYCTY